MKITSNINPNDGSMVDTYVKYDGACCIFKRPTWPTTNDIRRFKRKAKSIIIKCRQNNPLKY